VKIEIDTLITYQNRYWLEIHTLT